MQAAQLHHGKEPAQHPRPDGVEEVLPLVLGSHGPPREPLTTLAFSHLEVSDRRLQHEAGRALLRRLRAETGDRYFSVSHDGCWVVAAACDEPIGIDIVPRICPEIVIRRFFTPAEVALLDGLEPGVREIAAARMWAAKEAFAKSDGRGLRFPLIGLHPVTDANAGWKVVSNAGFPDVVLAGRSLVLP